MSHKCMIWFVFALLSAFFDATYYTLIKINLSRFNKYLMGTIIFFCSSIILFTISVYNGFPAIGPSFYYVLILTTCINYFATVLIYKSLDKGDISLVIPFKSLTPLFLILTSYFILNESTSFLGFLGILFIVSGSYFIVFDKNKNLLAPFKQLFKNRSIFFMIIVAFLFSISLNYDKLLIQNSDTYFGVSIEYAILSILFFVTYLLSKHNKNSNLSLTNIKLPILILVSLVLSLVAITMNLALTYQIVPYVTAIKRTSAIFVVLYGLVLFKEKSIKQRLLASAFMTIGAIIILFA
nr:hypothetical protein [Nanoarchaeum sp.]